MPKLEPSNPRLKELMLLTGNLTPDDKIALLFYALGSLERYVSDSDWDRAISAVRKIKLDGYWKWTTGQLIALTLFLSTVGLLLYCLAQHTLGTVWSVLACMQVLFFVVCCMQGSFRVIDEYDKGKEAFRVSQLERQRAMRAWIFP